MSEHPELPAGFDPFAGPAEPPGLTDTARQHRDRIMDAAEGIIAGEGIYKLSLGRIERKLGGMSRGQLCGRHAKRFAAQLRAVELRGITQHGGQALCAHFAANPLDNLLRRKRLAKYLHRQPPSRFADHISARAKPLA